MVSKAFASALAAAAALLGACGVGPRGEAARTAERLFQAVQDNDRAAFERLIDRPAIRADMRRQLLQFAQTDMLEIEGGASDFALDRMIGPDALQLVQAGTGARLAASPSADQIAPMMKPLEKGRVCLQNPQRRCLLVFAREKRKWRLVGMQAGRLVVPLPAARAD